VLGCGPGDVRRFREERPLLIDSTFLSILACFNRDDYVVVVVVVVVATEPKTETRTETAPYGLKFSNRCLLLTDTMNIWR
jgi:hypothetical protein